MSAMYKANFLFVGLLVVAVTATVAQNSDFRVDPRTDFSKFKTYAWDQSTNTERVTTQVDAQLAEAVESELAKKGLSKGDPDAANLLICYHSNFGTKQIKRYSMYQGESTYAWTIKTGELAIDMFDASTKKLVWRNTADINPKTKPQQVAKAVSNLLKNYPPKPK
jgi:hypothetical protein